MVGGGSIGKLCHIHYFLCLFLTLPLGELSKSKWKKLTEFSICWLTHLPPSVERYRELQNQLNKLYSWSAIEFIQLLCSSLYIETSIMCLINIIKIDKCKVLIDWWTSRESCSESRLLNVKRLFYLYSESDTVTGGRVSRHHQSSCISVRSAQLTVSNSLLNDLNSSLEIYTPNLSLKLLVLYWE